jgi:hypothetical protein
MHAGERRRTGGAAGGGGPSRGADSWRGLSRRAVRVARQRDLGGKALLLGAGALGGALAGAFLAVRGGAPGRRAVPAPVRGLALVWVVVRMASVERHLQGAGPGRELRSWRVLGSVERGWR